MIFYAYLNEEINLANGWIPLFIPVTERLMKKYKVRINGKVYKEYNDELVEAYKADTAWDLLMYREPPND